MRIRGYGFGNRGLGYFTEMCSGSEKGWYLTTMDFLYHSTLGVRVINKKKKVRGSEFGNFCLVFGVW